MPPPLDFFASVTIFFLLHQSTKRSCTQFSQHTACKCMAFVKRTSHQAQRGLDPSTAAHQARVSTSLGRTTQACGSQGCDLLFPIAAGIAQTAAGTALSEQQYLLWHGRCGSLVSADVNQFAACCNIILASSTINQWLQIKHFVYAPQSKALPWMQSLHQRALPLDFITSILNRTWRNHWALSCATQQGVRQGDSHPGTAPTLLCRHCSGQ